jgi:valyl-tRNA synthetase
LLLAAKAQYGLGGRKDVTFNFETEVSFNGVVVGAYRQLFERMVGAKQIIDGPPPKFGPSIVTPLGTFTLDLASQVDPVAEKQRLAKELEKVRGHIAGTEARLANKAFTDKAPPAVIDGAKKQLTDLRDKATEIERLIAALG